MTRTMLPTVLVLGLSCGLAFSEGTAVAPTTTTTEQPAKQALAAPIKSAPTKKARAARPAAGRVSGTVVSVDATTGKLSVKDKSGKVVEFTVSKATVTKDGKKVDLTGLSAEDHVTVSYKGSADNAEVTKVVAKSATATTKK